MRHGAIWARSDARFLDDFEVIVFFKVTQAHLSARALVDEARDGGRMGDFDERIRAVTHLDVTHHDIEGALTVIDGIVRRFGK